MRLAIHAIRALEFMLPARCLQILAWPAAAIVSAWQLAWVGRLPSSLRSDQSSPARLWKLWRRRINLNLTKLLVFWPDRLMKPRWRRRSDATALEELTRLSAQGRPVILVVLHFGPLAVVKYWMRAHGLAVAGLVERPLSQRPAHRVYLDNLNDTSSGLGGIPHLFDFTQLRHAVDFIQRQKLLMVAVESGRGHELLVEGDDYAFPMATGPIRMAARVNGLVVPCLALANGPFRLTLRLGRPVAADGDLQAVCAQVMDEFAPILRAHPEQCERELIRVFRRSRPEQTLRPSTELRQPGLSWEARTPQARR